LTIRPRDRIINGDQSRRITVSRWRRGVDPSSGESAMNLRISRLLAILAFVLGGDPSFAQNAYITNDGSNSVSVIATATNTVVAKIPVGLNPVGAAVTTDGSTVYVTNELGNTVSVIDAATNTVIATIPVGDPNGIDHPNGVAPTPDRTAVYVANLNDNSVSVIAAATNTVVAKISVGVNPVGVAVTADGSTVLCN
jgi:YVTN family beta-propeller protein